MDNHVLLLGRNGCRYSRKIERELASSKSVSLTAWNAGSSSEALPSDILHWQGDYIFAFRNPVILPGSLIRSARLGAINFHPGPPEYPGSGCAHFALLDQSASFGVTAHLMEETVDSGAILAVNRFAITESHTAEQLLSETHKALFNLAAPFIREAISTGKKFLSKSSADSASEKWSGMRRTMKSVNEMREIQPGMSEPELELMVRAFHLKEFPLFMNLHGRKFFLKD